MKANQGQGLSALHGADDGFISGDKITAFQEGMQDRCGLANGVFGGTVHSFTNPVRTRWG
jgi:dienelactone hydrolase